MPAWVLRCRETIALGRLLWVSVDFIISHAHKSSLKLLQSRTSCREWFLGESGTSNKSSELFRTYIHKWSYCVYCHSVTLNRAEICENVHNKLLKEIKILRATLEGQKDRWKKRILLAFQTVPPYPLQGVYLVGEQSRKQRTKIIITKSASRGPKKPRPFTPFHGKARSKILGDFIDLTRPRGGVGSTQFGL